MAITSAFQADDAGSIPVARSSKYTTRIALQSGFYLTIIGYQAWESKYKQKSITLCDDLL